MSTTDAVTMVLANNEVELPQDCAQFRALIEGYYVELIAFFGKHTSRLVKAYNEDIVEWLSQIVSMVESRYFDPGQKNMAYLIILTYIWRTTDSYLRELLYQKPDADAPAPPNFKKIRERLQEGSLEFLTTTPPGLLTPAEHSPRLLQYQQQRFPGNSGSGSDGSSDDDTRTGRNGGGGGGGGSSSGNDNEKKRTLVTLPNQNINLKNAWASQSYSSVFGEDSPFYDASAPKKRKVIPSDNPKKRICIPMAVTGKCYSTCGGKHGVLSNAEVGRVVTAGNLEL